MDVRRSALIFFGVVACSRGDTASSPPAAGSAGATPGHHEDRRDPQAAPTQLALTVTIAGEPSASWRAADFAKVAKMPGTASSGEARETWSLRALARQLVGPTARVTAVVGADGRVAIDEAAWRDATTTPILHSTRRGTLKFRYADAAGAWGETVAKEVTGLEIRR